MLARAGGANVGGVLSALQGGFADSPVLREHGRRMACGDFAPGGPAKYMLKDLKTVLTEAAGLDSVQGFLSEKTGSRSEPATGRSDDPSSSTSPPTADCEAATKTEGGLTGCLRCAHLACSRFEAVVEAGDGDSDMSVVAMAVERETRVRVARQTTGDPATLELEGSINPTH